MTLLECLMVALIDYECGPVRARELVDLAQFLYDEQNEKYTPPPGVQLRDTASIDVLAKQLAERLVETP